jgi:hypothetical protein
LPLSSHRSLSASPLAAGPLYQRRPLLSFSSAHHFQFSHPCVFGFVGIWLGASIPTACMAKRPLLEVRQNRYIHRGIQRRYRPGAGPFQRPSDRGWQHISAAFGAHHLTPAEPVRAWGVQRSHRRIDGRLMFCVKQRPALELTVQRGRPRRLRQSWTPLRGRTLLPP